MLTLYTQLMSFLQVNLRSFSRDEKGATIVEYTIMVALVALAVAFAAPNIRDAVVGIFDTTATTLDGMNP